MNKSYVSFIMGLALALSTASCGRKTDALVPAKDNGPQVAKPGAVEPEDGDWTIIPQQLNCDSNPSFVSKWKEAYYTFNGDSGYYTAYLGPSTSRGTNYVIVPLSVKYSDATTSGGTVTFSDFGTVQCGKVDMTNQGIATAPCADTYPTAPKSGSIQFSYTLGTSAGYAIINLSSKGAVDTLSCELGKPSTSQLVLN